MAHQKAVHLAATKAVGRVAEMEIQTAARRDSWKAVATVGWTAAQLVDKRAE